LRKFIPNYAYVSQPLLDRKTLLLKGAPLKGQARKEYVKKCHLDSPIGAEKAAYEQLKTEACKATVLAFFDPTRPAFIDVDVSKQRGFRARFFHVKGDKVDLTKSIPAALIEPILYLSRTLAPAEKNY